MNKEKDNRRKRIDRKIEAKRKEKRFEISSKRYATEKFNSRVFMGVA